MGYFWVFDDKASNGRHLLMEVHFFAIGRAQILRKALKGQETGTLLEACKVAETSFQRASRIHLHARKITCMKDGG